MREKIHFTAETPRAPRFAEASNSASSLRSLRLCGEQIYQVLSERRIFSRVLSPRFEGVLAGQPRSGERFLSPKDNARQSPFGEPTRLLTD